ncbi:hypothetical protein [Streptomyces sp. WAC08241]|uniref:hypothetical protein n=1 Tax=Streptomyces sp. WAC08241 TaxID=2487421 RepID=UPI000F7737FE|nr:hypothetical protein [Streptomyces sp. WAC08241]RSS47133.1 hypothetical protein EF906_00350 [Streptomyces sp. WAC08241]
MTTAPLESPTTRVPGRAWTVRLTGHSDRTASVTCTSSCTMPARSRDLASLRAFAARHAAAHARVATVRPDAACHCRAGRCEAHPGDKTSCAGEVVMILRHDPVVGQVWIVEEVCAMCAPHIPHARILARAAAPAGRTAAKPAARTRTLPRPSVPSLFSSAGASEAGADTIRRPRRPHRRPRQG